MHEGSQVLAPQGFQPSRAWGGGTKPPCLCLLQTTEREGRGAGKLRSEGAHSVM